jgi:DNA-binding NarL/FixJ family response regulator
VERLTADDVSSVILIADGDAVARRALGRTLRDGGYRVSEVERGDEVLDVARRDRPALAILEIPLEVLSGYEVCRVLKADFGASFPVLFLSGVRTESYDRVAGLLIGADDYVIKPYAPDELLARVRRLEANSRSAAETIASGLTPRESEVLGLLAEGLAQREIAARLTISPKTVGTHIEHVLRKLGVHNRAQAVAVALRENGSRAVADEAVPPLLRS